MMPYESWLNTKHHLKTPYNPIAVIAWNEEEEVDALLLPPASYKVVTLREDPTRSKKTKFGGNTGHPPLV